VAFFSALQVHGAESDIILAIVDDYSPTAVDERGSAMRVFFAAAGPRDAAHTALAAAGVTVERIEVDDEDWARRSQENLAPITVGRITVYPTSVASRQSPVARHPSSATSHEPPIAIVIAPSMGFGTGHHATTRLCLGALQTIDLSHAFVLDVGTGSGVLAIAASRLGAARAAGIDSDPDAVRSARESLALNPDARGVELDVSNLMTAPLPRADVVTANLTGALLVRAVGRLVESVRPGGTLIVSGLLAEERETVRAAFAPLPIAAETQEDGWVCLTFRT
jgi:ribosomal protein L11 methyltransferase